VSRANTAQAASAGEQPTRGGCAGAEQESLLADIR